MVLRCSHLLRFRKKRRYSANSLVSHSAMMEGGYIPKNLGKVLISERRGAEVAQQKAVKIL